MPFIIDSYGEPSSHLLNMPGCVGCTRYISHSRGKNLTAGQVARIHGHGKRIIGNFEDSATRGRAGAAGGVADAVFTIRFWRNVGGPKGCGLYASSDEELHRGSRHWNAEVAYQRAFTATMRANGYLGGAYGDHDFISYLLDHGYIDFGWATKAWSYGHVDPRAVIVQDKFTRSYDRNTIQHDYMGAWMPYGAQHPNTPPPAPPTPKPAPPNLLEQIMALDRNSADYKNLVNDIAVASASNLISRVLKDENGVTHPLRTWLYRIPGFDPHRDFALNSPWYVKNFKKGAK